MESSKINLKNPSVSDFALDDSFIHWVINKDQQSEEFWEEWMHRHPSHVNTIKKARSIVLAMRFKEEHVSPEDVKVEWLKTYSRLNDTDDSVPVVQMYSQPWKMFKVAAVFACFIALCFIAHFAIKYNDQKHDLVSTQSSKGQKLTIKLSDGTEVRLNADSRLEYPNTFDGDVREVILHGEAFFNVAHNSEVPFKVITHNITTTVLGTSFNIKAYPEQTAISVALVQGSVRVDGLLSRRKKEEILLKPSEMVIIDTASLNNEVTVFNADKLLAWKDDVLYFEKASFNEIISTLERWYGVNITVASKSSIDADWRFSGSFRDRSLEYVLKTLSYPDLFSFTITNQQVVIEFKP